MFKNLILFVVFLVVFQFMKGQEPVSIHLNQKDGLHDNEIYSMIEDSLGNIWLAGNKGLFRYDGNEFKMLSHPKKQGRSFFNLQLDDKGRIWCNNIAGQFFYIEENRLVLFEDYGDLLKGILSDFLFFKNQLVIKIYDKDKSKNRLVFIDLTTKAIKITDRQSFGTSIGTVFDSNFYRFDKDFNLVLYKKDSDEIKASITDLTNYFTNFNSTKTGFFITKSNNRKINTEIYFYNGILQKYVVDNGLLNFRIEQILQEKNKLYLSTANGIYVCYIQNNKIKISKHWLKGSFVTSVIKDKNGNLWAATLENGVFVIPNESLLKINTDVQVSVIAKLNNHNAAIGSADGRIYNFDINYNELKPSKFITNSIIRDIDYEPIKDQIFVATNDENTIISRSGDIIYRFPENSGIKSSQLISPDTLVISTSSGTRIKTKSLDKKITLIRSYKSIFSKKEKCIYLCDVEGLKVFDANGNYLKTITYNDNPIFAFDIVEAKDNKLYLATYDKGIVVIKNDTVLKVINTEDGLASNAINTLSADKNDLWIATENGLQFYDVEAETFQTLTKQDGINSYSINQIKTFDDTVLFSSNLGLFSFNKHQVFRKRKLSNPYITNVFIEERDTILLPNYKLKQTESSIRFNFNTRGFQSKSFVKYQYQLEGFDDKWIPVEDGSNYVKFTALPSGEFTFKLRAKNKFENQFSKVTSIPILVTLPFYKTWLFYLLLFIISVFIIYKFFSVKNKRLKKQQSIELEKAKISKDLVFSQLENLRSQMNPHFIFNALNSIQDYIITNEKKLARQYLVKFSRLIRIYLDHSRTSEISLTEELRALSLYLELEKDRFDDDFEFKINVDDTLDRDVIKVPSLLIQPYVENALKHGLLHKMSNKKLELNFSKSQTQNTMLCSIEDNGVGRAASEKINRKRINHKSFAISANQQRIDLINVAKQTNLNVETIDLFDINKKPTGTRVLIKIPL